MAGFKDDVPMLSETHAHSSDGVDSGYHQRFKTRVRRASLSIPINSVELYDGQSSLVTHTGSLRNERKIPIKQMSGPLYISYRPERLQQCMDLETAEPKTEKFPSFNGIDQKEWSNDNYGGKNEHLLRSGQLGMCSDPYCTCPTYYKAVQRNNDKASGIFDSKFLNVLHGDAKGWARKFLPHLCSYVRGIMNPLAEIVHWWSQLFLILCLIAVFVDPLFFFYQSVQKEDKCIVIDGPLIIAIALFRSVTDFVYFLHRLLQYRLAYVAPKLRAAGAGDVVDHLKKIALNFLLDLFVVLPLPQIMILVVVPKRQGSTRAKDATNLLGSILVQYFARLFRFQLLLSGQSATGFAFETAWSNFFIKLLNIALSGHVVGSWWYLNGVQRVKKCLRSVCDGNDGICELIYCGHDFRKLEDDPLWPNWKNKTATACFDDVSPYPYGIYKEAIKLTTERSIITRYVYSVFWGFQQISTLAGNQTPSYNVWEVLFTMGIIALGLVLFALLIGSMQNILQSLGKRRIEMILRRRDVKQWMSHHRLPAGLKRQVRQAERYNWVATRGVNEQMLLESLPEDLQREIRRYLFKYIKKVWIFAQMDEPMLDAIYERLRQKRYNKGSKILCRGCLVDKIVFVVRGELESIGEDGIPRPLRKGDVCGEELVTWYLEHSSINKDVEKIRRQKLLSNRMVTCVTNVEAFTLKATDLEEVTSLFSRSLNNARIQGPISYESPHWRSMPARRIQVAWRYRKKRLVRANTSNT